MDNSAQFDGWDGEPSDFDLVFFHVANRVTEDAEANVSPQCRRSVSVSAVFLSELQQDLSVGLSSAIRITNRSRK